MLQVQDASILRVLVRTPVRFLNHWALLPCTDMVGGRSDESNKESRIFIQTVQEEAA
jgi:hypothetical protein